MEETLLALFIGLCCLPIGAIAWLIVFIAIKEYYDVNKE